MIELAVDYETADYMEGRRVIVREQGKKYRKPLLTVLGIWVAGYVGLSLVVIFGDHLFPGRTTEPTFAGRFAMALIPQVIWLAIIALLVPALLHRSCQRLALGLLLVAAMGIGCAVAQAMLPPTPDTPDGPTPAGLEWAAILGNPMVFWLTLVLFIWLMLLSVSKLQAHRFWDDQPHLTQRHTIRLSPDGVEVQTVHARYEYQWYAFIGWKETARLFVLMPSKFTMVMIPKRACRDAGELEQLRQILQAHVPNRPPGAAGIPVIPFAQRVSSEA